MANRTRYFVRIFVNRTLVGTMAPYSQLWCNAAEGQYRMRAIARFNNGSALRWKPYQLHVAAEEVSNWTLRY